MSQTLSKSHNRIAGGFSPPASTTPRMWVCTGRFLWSSKENADMVSFNAAYPTHCQGRFTFEGDQKKMSLLGG